MPVLRSTREERPERPRGGAKPSALETLESSFTPEHHRSHAWSGRTTSPCFDVSPAYRVGRRNLCRTNGRVLGRPRSARRPSAWDRTLYAGCRTERSRRFLRRLGRRQLRLDCETQRNKHVFPSWCAACAVV